MKKKLLSMILALAMLCSMFVPAMAAEETPVAPYAIPDVKGKLVILHTNDTHGRIMEDDYNKVTGMTAVAAVKEQYEAAGANVLILDAGDTMHGLPIAGASKGESVVTVMNSIGYAAMAPGNHDFNYGYERLLELSEDMTFPILAANLTYADSGKLVFKDHITAQAGDLKVGIFGLATVETTTKTNPNNVKGLKFAEGKELYACAQAQIDALKADGCDVIIAIGHLGVDKGSVGNTSLDVIQKTKGIDLFVDGHSHTPIDAGKITANQDLFLDISNTGSTTLVSNGNYLGSVGVATYDGKAFTGILRKDVVADETVSALIKKYNDEVKELYSGVLGETEVKLDGTKAPGNRTQETNLGDFSTDAMMYAAKKAGYTPDVALTNGGGIRESIEIGAITEYNMVSVFPFGNQVVIFDIPGSALQQAIEDNTKSAPAADGGFPQVAGMSYTVDTSAKYAEGETNRVTISEIGGKAFDPQATYSLATNDFIGVGGDNYKIFRDYFENKMSGISLEDAMMTYVKEGLNGVVDETYAQPAGRITVKYADVKSGQWYTDAAYYVLTEGIMKGTNKTDFTPSGTVTRGTVVQMLYNLAGKPTEGIEKAAFNDIDGKWYSDAAHWANFVGIADGKADGSFGGDEVIARAEIAQILSQYAYTENIIATDGGMAMKEAPDYAAIPAEYLNGMAFCYYNGVMTGNGKGELLPNANVTRDQLAQIMYNFSKLEPTYTEEVVEIKVPATSGVPAHTMVGTLTIPTSASKTDKAPAVVMLHGTGSNRDEAGMGYAIAAPAMAAQGVATLRIDFMGTAADDVANYKHYSYTSANIDAKAAADYLAKLENIDGKNLGVMGWSQGGTNALLAAAKYPTTFKAVVTWAGAIDLSILFGDQAGFDAAYATAKKDGSFTMKLDWRTPSDLPVGVKWFEDVKNTNVLNEIAKIKAPILAIHGEKDTTVDPESAAKIVTASKNTDSDTHMIAECDHTFNVFSGDYTALTDAITAGTLFFMDSFGMIAEEVAPAA